MLSLVQVRFHRRQQQSAGEPETHSEVINEINSETHSWTVSLASLAIFAAKNTQLNVLQDTAT